MTETTSPAKAGTFILPMYAGLFQFLRKASLFGVLSKRVTASSYHRFVDVWVLGNLALAGAAVIFSTVDRIVLWELVLIIYGAVRCFELAVLHANQLFFDEYRWLRDKPNVPLPPLNYRRLVIHILHNYAEIALWFAFFYRNLSSHWGCPNHC